MSGKPWNEYSIDHCVGLLMVLGLKKLDIDPLRRKTVECDHAAVVHRFERQLHIALVIVIPDIGTDVVHFKEGGKCNAMIERFMFYVMLHQNRKLQ